MEVTPFAAATAPLKETVEAPFRFAPIIVTFVPGLPKNGEKLKIDGGTTKLLDEKVWPPGLETLIGPVVALVGTVTVICVFESTKNDCAKAPLNFTKVAPIKFFPVITTFVPLRPTPGEKLVMLGDAKKLLLVVPVRFERVRLIGPVVTLAGAEIFICVSLVMGVMAAFILSLIALLGTRNGYGPFSTDSINQSFLLLQAFTTWLDSKPKMLAK